MTLVKEGRKAEIKRGHLDSSTPKLPQAIPGIKLDKPESCLSRIFPQPNRARLPEVKHRNQELTVGLIQWRTTHKNVGRQTDRASGDEVSLNWSVASSCICTISDSSLGKSITGKAKYGPWSTEWIYPVLMVATRRTALKPTTLGRSGSSSTMKPCDDHTHVKREALTDLWPVSAWVLSAGTYVS